MLFDGFLNDLLTFLAELKTWTEHRTCADLGEGGAWTPDC